MVLGRCGQVSKIVFHVEITADVAERFFGECHLAEVIAPCVLARATADKRLASHSLNRAVRHAALKALSGNLKRDLSARLPEGRGEFVREEQGVVIAMLFERGDGVCGVRPRQREARGVPATEFESIRASPADDDLQ